MNPVFRASADADQNTSEPADVSSGALSGRAARDSEQYVGRGQYDADLSVQFRHLADCVYGEPVWL